MQSLLAATSRLDISVEHCSGAKQRSGRQLGVLWFALRQAVAFLCLSLLSFRFTASYIANVSTCFLRLFQHILFSVSLPLISPQLVCFPFPISSLLFSSLLLFSPLFFRSWQFQNANEFPRMLRHRSQTDKHASETKIDQQSNINAINNGN